MLLIYSPYKNPRLEYILQFIFNRVVFVSYTLTSNIDDYKNYAGPKIIYSPNFITKGKWIWASTLLNETSIHHDLPETVDTEWGKVIFATGDARTFIPFDIFSASFWLICRYEEYILPQKDHHQRFDFHYSWAEQQQLLHKPVVNEWIEKMILLLKAEFPTLLIERPLYKHIPTIDVDNLYAFKGKSLITSLLSTAKAALYLRGDLIKQRFLYSLHKINDPYDTYSYVCQQYASHHLTPIFFILTSKKDQYDRNLYYRHPLFVSTVEQLNKSVNIGIHLSYYAIEKNTAADEIKALSSVCHHSIHQNRFHFMKFQLPEYYRQLVQLGISEDYSMGYVETDGFRAATCTPFYFFDLEQNKKTSLRVFPVPFIDKTLFDSLKLNSEEAIQKISDYIHIIKKYNGVFVSLWHNETLQDIKPWKSWKTVFEEMLNLE